MDYHGEAGCEMFNANAKWRRRGGERCLGLLALLCGLGCAMQGGEDGGGANLPNRGVAPYELVRAEVEAVDGELPEGEGDVVILIPAADETSVEEPSAVVRPDGALDLYLEVRGDTGGSVAVAQSRDGGLSFSEPEVLFESWQGKRVSSPSVVWSEGRCLLAFEVGDGEGIAIATSADGRDFTLPETLTLTPEAEELGGIGSPSLLVTPGGQELFFTASLEDGGPKSIARASSATGTWEREGVVFEAGAGCEDSGGEEAPCWDLDGVESPEVRFATTGAGRTVYRMMYTGVSGRNTLIGFAASWDGQVWVRYEFNPIITTRTRAPTNVLFDDRYLLFMVQAQNNAEGVIQAINGAGEPSERF